MASLRTLTTRIVIRNDTTANWLANKEVLLLKGEIGIEFTPTNEVRMKIGDGVTEWPNLEYFSDQGNVVIHDVAPTPADSDLEVGTLWFYNNTTTNKYVAYLLYDNTDSNAIWKQIVTPDDLSDLGAGDMLKSQFANNPKVQQGYVNAAITADKLTDTHTFTVSGDITGTAQSFNGTQDVNIPIVIPASTVTGKLTGAISTVLTNDVTASRAIISDADGKISVSPVTSTEIGYLAGVTGGIQAQLDSMPKYNWLDATSISIADGSTQEQINTAAIAKIGTVVTTPAKYDTLTVQVTFTPSDTVKDGVYTYNGTAWVFLYYSTTGINRANGETAGIVENSDDITFVDGQGTVVQASKVKNALKFGAKTFDGSSAQTLLLSDLGGLSITDATNTYLPLTGGEVTGSLTAPFIISKSVEGETSHVVSLGRNVQVGNYVKSNSVINSQGAGEPLTLIGSSINLAGVDYTSNIQLKGLAAPTEDTDAVNKKYVDDHSSSYTLPVATASILGGVKASTAVDQINIDANGLMTVNTISTNKLVDGALFLMSTDTFIIDGGGA